ncbi:MAG: class I SAM-dependent methyltransferase [Rhizobiaceae bacterium]|nr:class I SAM-dependent methyltransferase [Rhizobiaceae bacterium]
MSQIERIFHTVMRHLRTSRSAEYKVVEAYFAGCNSLLDVGCGTGTFLERDPARRTGVDLNAENVDYCKARGLSAEVGSATSLPFPNASFDGLFCSHVFQVFSPNEAATAVKEFGRVVKPGGVVVISTLNNFRNFFQHPENSRPYPPDALLRYFQTQHGVTSPMWPGMPMMAQEDIWLRRPPLIRLRSATRPRLDRIMAGFNQLQYGMYLVNPFAFDSYVIKLRNHGSTREASA